MNTPKRKKKNAVQHPPRWKVFLDEAGNTGTNHIDDSQPYYVLAGWIVAEENVDAARAVARERLQPVQAKQTERKGAELVKSAKGRAQLAELFAALGKAGALPFFVAIHKRYSLAGRFVEYFLDPLHNPRVWKEWFASRDIKRRFAAEIAALPNPVVDQIQVVFRDGLVSDGENCVSAICDSLRSVGNEPLAQKVEGIRGHTNPAVEELSSLDGPKSKTTTPNFAAFATALQSLGMQARSLGFDLTFVHDGTASFEATFTKCYETLKDLDPDSFLGRAIDRVAPGAVPLASVSGLTFERSHDEPLVQTADALAATAAWFLRGEAEETRVPGEAAAGALALVVLGTILYGEAQFCHLIAADQEIEAVAARLKRIVEPQLEAKTNA